MRNYDFEKAKELIQQHSKRLAEAAMGMHEDWWWTAECVWENGEYCKGLSDDTVIGGISGSNWATPTLQMTFKDGAEKMIACFTGERSGEAPLLALGCLSRPVQYDITPITED